MSALLKLFLHRAQFTGHQELKKTVSLVSMLLHDVVVVVAAAVASVL